jgi:molybdate-binding protein
VAAAIAAGQADVGFGLESAARAYGLDFLFQVQERYDLVAPEQNMLLPPVRRLAEWLAGEDARQAILGFDGYDVSETGTLRWLD